MKKFLIFILFFLVSCFNIKPYWYHQDTINNNIIAQFCGKGENKIFAIEDAINNLNTKLKINLDINAITNQINIDNYDIKNNIHYIQISIEKAFLISKIKLFINKNIEEIQQNFTVATTSNIEQKRNLMIINNIIINNTIETIKQLTKIDINLPISNYMTQLYDLKENSYKIIKSTNFVIITHNKKLKNMFLSILSNQNIRVIEEKKSNILNSIYISLLNPKIENIKNKKIIIFNYNIMINNKIIKEKIIKLEYQENNILTEDIMLKFLQNILKDKQHNIIITLLENEQI